MLTIDFKNIFRLIYFIWFYIFLISKPVLKETWISYWVVAPVRLKFKAYTTVGLKEGGGEGMWYKAHKKNTALAKD